MPQQEQALTSTSFSRPRVARWLTLAALIVGGEVIFALPFHIARFFRPTFLEAFGLTNTQLGDLFAVYGIMAMLCYFPGGLLADRFNARRLATLALLATAAGGVGLLSYPDADTMAVMYGVWGVTTILLFWGALIRATREWGGDAAQGTAFGLLDAGRGIVAAVVAATAAHLFALKIGTAELDPELRREAFRTVILVYTVATAFAALLTWVFVPDRAPTPATQRLSLLGGAGVVLRRPIVWTQAGIVIAAYCAFKAVDNYSLYLVSVLGMSETDAATLSAWSAYLRPAGAIAAGLLADRLRASTITFAAFALLALAFTFLAAVQDAALELIFANLAVSYVAASGLRAVYFALLEENRTPKGLTGTTVGVVSVTGFTPDVFFAPLTGRILDAAPGAEGFRHYFVLMAAISSAGVLITAALLWLHRRGSLWPEREINSTGTGSALSEGDA